MTPDAGAGYWVRSKYWPEPLELIGTYGAEGEHPIYNNLVPAFAEVIRRRVKSDNQAVIVVTGATGSGKSNLAIQLAKALDKNWKLSDNYIYSVEDLKTKLRTPGASPISLYDEGSVSLNSLDWNKKGEGKEIPVLFDTMRSLHWITIICIPSIRDLSKRIRENHVNYMLECPSKAPLWGYAPRGFFKIYKQINYNLSGGHFWQNIGTGTFSPISTRLNNEYQALKRRSQSVLINKFINEA